MLHSWLMSLVAALAAAHPASDVHGAVAAQPLQNEPPAKLVIDSPRAEPLSRGAAEIQYRTENLHIVPVFGPAAIAVSPRIGHIHVTVDDAACHRADASGEPVIIMGLAPGPHNIPVELVSASHQPIDNGAVQVTMPAARSTERPQPEAN